MDERIITAILNSCETATKNLENSEDYKTLLQEGKFLPTSIDIFNALCSSLTNLLSYKVSKEACQRYTVRLHVIDVVRDWCRISDIFKNYKIFRDEKQTLTLLKNLLQKYLTDDVLDNCESGDDLVPLASALMCLVRRNSEYKCYLKDVLLKLVELEPGSQSKYLLCYAVRRKSNLNLEISTVEKIYKSQKCELIEQPLLNDFTSSCNNLNKDDDENNSESVDLVDELINFATESPYIFLLICGFLKELLVQLDYVSSVVDFVQSIFKRIKECCERQSKNILDLYPRNLQSLVILLQIDPTYHTHDSKCATLQLLENIYTEDKDTVITLLSHYPQWLKSFGERLESDDIR